MSETIIIEMDGPIHEMRSKYDKKRDEWLRSKGYTLFRIKNEDLKDRFEVVVQD